MMHITLLKNKRIVLVITESRHNEVFHALCFASLLIQAGTKLHVVLSPGAQQFLSAFANQPTLGNKSYRADNSSDRRGVLQKVPSQNIDLMIIAPCNNYIAQELSNSLTKGSLTLPSAPDQKYYPVLIVRALDKRCKSASIKTINRLTEHGVYIVQPPAMDCVRPSELLGYVRMILGKKGRLAEKKIVVTAGGTQEAIDPVRMITNRSSGKQGYALAQAAIDQGAHVTLITTPTSLPTPIGAKVLRVYNAQQMFEAVLAESNSADALLMAAAVADFRAKGIASNKIKKQEGVPQIELEVTPDILAAITRSRLQKKHPRIVVGFAAESHDLIRNATLKLRSKQADIIVANDITTPDAGFGVDTNRVILLFADGRKELLPLITKVEVAEIICRHVTDLLRTRNLG